MKTKTLFPCLGVALMRSRVVPALMAALNFIPAGRVTAQTFTTLHSFTDSDGLNPRAELILSGNTLYGTAEDGGSFDHGVVFAVDTSGTGFRNLHSFTATSGSGGYYGTNSDGANPSAGLITNSLGNTLYGTAVGGGNSGYGTVFAVNTDGTGFKNLHSFTALSSIPYLGTNRDGAYPNGLILSGSTLYGTTSQGGSSGYGTVFAVGTDGTGYTNLHNFAALDPNYYTNRDGAFPLAGLILSGRTLYGTAYYGGNLGHGTMFAINTDGTGFTNLHNFAGFPSGDGSSPSAKLLLSGDLLYGTAEEDGSAGFGAVFAVHTDGTGFTNLHNFEGFPSGDGAHPKAGLILSGSTLYGTAYEGNSFDQGTIFAVNIDGTGYTNLYSFTGLDDGANPQAGLILSGNTLYGTAKMGGDSYGGTVFSLSFPGPQLAISTSGTNVTLSWPLSFAGFSYIGFNLEVTANLGSPDAWVPSDFFPPEIVNGQLRLTGPMRGPQRFYRLRKL